MGFWFVFIGTGVGVFELFTGGWVGNSPIEKIARGFCREGGWSGLELTDTLVNKSLLTVKPQGAGAACGSVNLKNESVNCVGQIVEKSHNRT